jgi:hypothetical protein
LLGTPGDEAVDVALSSRRLDLRVPIAEMLGDEKAA